MAKDAKGHGSWKTGTGPGSLANSKKLSAQHATMRRVRGQQVTRGIYGDAHGREVMKRGMDISDQMVKNNLESPLQAAKNRAGALNAARRWIGDNKWNNRKSGK